MVDNRKVSLTNKFMKGKKEDDIHSQILRRDDLRGRNFRRICCTGLVPVRLYEGDILGSKPNLTFNDLTLAVSPLSSLSRSYILWRVTDLQPTSPR